MSRVRRMLGLVLITVAALYLGLAAALWAVQRQILFQPDTARPDAGAVGVAALREVELVAEDGVRLLAWYVPPPAGRPVLLYFHGNGGNLDNRARRVRLVAAAGFGLLMVEYRGYGGNPGHPTEQGFYADAAAGLRFLGGQGVEPTRLVVYGESIGTGVATWVAARQPVGALVLESPYTSIAAVAARQFPLLPVSWLLKDRFDSLSRIGQIRAPLLILQGGRDRVIPPDLGRDLFAAAADPKRLWTAPEADHNDLMRHGAEEVLVEFIRTQVRAETPHPASAPP